MSEKDKTRKSNLTVNEDETYEEALKRYGLSPSKNGHYVDKAELYEHMVKYCEAREKAKADGAEPPRIDDYIAECIVKIATHLSYLPNFNGYTYRQDFVSDAIENCLPYIFGASSTICDLDPDADDEKRLLRGTIVAAVNKMYLDCCFVAMRQEEALWPGILGDLE